MTADETKTIRAQLTLQAMDMIAKHGAAVGKAELAHETRISRARIDAIFPDESDLFGAIVEQWYSYDVAVMEEVVASDLPIQRKFFEFFARRFLRERQRFAEDPALFALYCELGHQNFEQVRGYIDLADHYLTELIAQAQDEGFFQGLEIDQALSLINQMVIAYTSPQMMMIISPRLSEEKLARIVDTIFIGLSAEDGGARGVNTLRLAT